MYVNDINTARWTRLYVAATTAGVLNLDILGGSNMTGTDFLNHNYQTLTCTCQSST